VRSIVAAIAAAILVSGGAEASSGDAGVQFVRLAPPTVRGTGFQPDERVVVTLFVSDRPHVRRGRTSGAGVFTVRFSPFIAVDPCRGALRVVARGSLGTTASLRRACRPPHPR
jgi:hypothetical protein